MTNEQAKSELMHIYMSLSEEKKKALDVLMAQADKDCRDCTEWESCPCGKDGHEKGTAQGYSAGECKDYKQADGDLISRQAAIKAIEERAKRIKNEDTLNGLAGAVGILFELPSVKPQEPPKQECKKCKHYPDNDETCLECEYEGITRGYTRYEQEPAYCDRNICLKNEYNNIGCDECEVGNPCLYCKHEFEPQESEERMTCDECKYFKIIQEPLRTEGTIFDFGRVRCEKHNLISDFCSISHKEFEQLDTCEDFEPQERSDKE